MTRSATGSGSSSQKKRAPNATRDGQRSAVATIHRRLRPGDILIGARRHAIALALDDSGHRVERRVLHRTTDPLQQLMTEVWAFTELDVAGTALRRDQETLRMRWTYRFEMRYLLEASGFEVEAEHAGFRGGAPRYAAEQIWVARRPAG